MSYPNSRTATPQALYRFKSRPPAIFPTPAPAGGASAGAQIRGQTPNQFQAERRKGQTLMAPMPPSVRGFPDPIAQCAHFAHPGLLLRSFCCFVHCHRVFGHDLPVYDPHFLAPKGGQTPNPHAARTSLQGKAVADGWTRNARGSSRSNIFTRASLCRMPVTSTRCPSRWASQAPAYSARDRTTRTRCNWPYTSARTITRP